MSEGPITYFDGTEFDFLSNFHPSPIRWRDPWGRWHNAATVEAIFQAEKSTDAAEYLRIIRAREPGRAKRLGRSAKYLRHDWDVAKYDIMHRALQKKFAIKELGEKLIATGVRYLIEGNVWHDNIWGDCQCHRCEDVAGENALGRLLMQVRSELT